jgi:RimJ/RimL family protein N-acetyltransferase
VDRDQGGTLSATGTDALTLRPLAGTTAQMAALQCVLEAAPGYFRIVGGAPPGRAEAQSLFSALPVGKGYEDKFVWGLYSSAAMIGCADVIRGYPTSDKAVIGLMLLAEPWQRRGLGRAFAMLVEQAIAGWSAIERLRIGVALANPRALAFWKRVGYVETGEVKLAESTGVMVAVLEKPLAPPATHG